MAVFFMFHIKETFHKFGQMRADMAHLQPGLQAPQYLLYRENLETNKSFRLPDKYAYAAAEVIRDFGRRRAPLGILANGFIKAVQQEVRYHLEKKSGETEQRKRAPLHDFVRSEFTLHRDIDLANRMANQLVYRLTHNPPPEESEGKRTSSNGSSMIEEFRRHFFQSRENPAHSDHNREHLRRVELFSKIFSINTSDVRGEIAINRHMPALMLADQFHDVDQSLSLQRNEVLEAYGENKLEVKKAHCEAGAVMILSLYKEYARVNHITEADAWRICAEAALMTLKHDKIDVFNKAIKATESAVGMDDETLIKKYKEHEVDMYTLSPQQLILVLKTEKGAEGDRTFVNEAAPHGLAPSFERQFRKELGELEVDTLPLFSTDRFERMPPVGNKQYKKSFETVSQIFLFSDTSDMTTPAIEGFFRTLRTQYSLNRPFMSVNLNEGELNELFHLIVDLRDPNAPHDEKSRIKKLEKKYDRDVFRKLFESCHFADPIAGTVLENGLFIRGFIKDAAILNALATQKFGRLIMKKQYGQIEEMYKKRIRALSEKALKKVGLEPKDFPNAGDTDVIEALKKRNDRELAEIYRQKIESIRAEMEELIGSFETEQKATDYSPEDLRNFEQLTDKVIEHLRLKYKVSNKEMVLYNRYIETGEYPKTIPYGGYDSLGRSRGVRRIAGKKGRIFDFDLSPYFETSSLN